MSIAACTPPARASIARERHARRRRHDALHELGATRERDGGLPAERERQERRRAAGRAGHGEHVARLGAGARPRRTSLHLAQQRERRRERTVARGQVPAHDRHAVRGQRACASARSSAALPRALQPRGTTSATSAQRGSAAIAARSERFAAASRAPASSGVSTSRRKWRPSTNASVVATRSRPSRSAQHRGVVAGAHHHALAARQPGDDARDALELGRAQARDAVPHAPQRQQHGEQRSPRPAPARPRTRTAPAGPTRSQSTPASRLAGSSAAPTAAW